MFVSAEKAVLAMLALIVLATVVMVVDLKSSIARREPTSVPNPIPPVPLAPPQYRPFSIVCPYCRNSLSVQSSATGQTTGAVVEAAVKPSAK